MKPLIISGAVACACALLIFAQNNPTTPKPNLHKPSAEELAIEEVEAKRLKALLSGDWQTMEKVWSDDLVVVTGSGDVRRKAHRLYSMKNGLMKYDEIKNSDVSIIVHNDKSAVVTGTAKRKGRDGTNDLSGYFRFTRTWVKNDKGEWQLALQHSTPIAKKDQ